MIIFAPLDPVGKAERNRQPHLIFRLVLAVTPAPLGLPELDRCKRLLPGKLRHIVDDAVFILECRLLKARSRLVFQDKRYTVVDDRLALDRVHIKFKRDIDLGKYLQIGLPPDF